MFDQQSDRSFRVFAEKLTQFGPEARELVKEAEVNYDELEGLPEDAFAWSERRMFPIHSPEHTALSLVYAAGESLPEHVTNRLEKAAALYGVELHQAEKVAEETVESPDDYLIPHRKFGRVDSADLVKEAADFYSRNYKKMDLVTRTNAATTLVKKASAFDVELPVNLKQQAGLTQVDRTKLAEWLEVRSSMAKEQPVREGFQKLAEFVMDKNQFSRASRQDLIKLAETIATLDQREGLDSRYDYAIPDPMLTVFNTAKIAGESSVNLAGKNISVTKLLQIDPRHYAEVLGDDVLPEISEKNGSVREAELIDVLKSLPADLQLQLVRSLNL